MSRSWRVVVLWVVSAASAWAQESPKRSDEDLFLIQGQVQKPEVVVVIPRENLDKDFVLELKDSFLHRIVEALDRPPF